MIHAWIFALSFFGKTCSFIILQSPEYLGTNTEIDTDSFYIPWKLIDILFLLKLLRLCIDIALSSKLLSGLLFESQGIL